MNSKPTSDPSSTEQIYVVSGGHLFHDLFTSFLPPILPTLIENLSLSLTSVGFITSIARIPSILNPFIGYFADKAGAKYFVILSPPHRPAAMVGRRIESDPLRLWPYQQYRFYLNDAMLPSPQMLPYD